MAALRAAIDEGDASGDFQELNFVKFLAEQPLKWKNAKSNVSINQTDVDTGA